MKALLKLLIIVSLSFFILISMYVNSRPYPIDGYPATGIRRLERLRLINEQIIPGAPIPAGALKKLSEIKLNLTGSNIDRISALPRDPVLQKKIDALFGGKNREYFFAVLDITNPETPRFAAFNGEKRSAPASVGKLAIAAGLFAQLKSMHPKNIAERTALLKNRIVRADRWVIRNHHNVPMFDPLTNSYVSRKVREGDEFSLYEWLDAMLSASSNAAASIVWKEVILMKAFGKDYPPDETAENKYFNSSAKEDLKRTALSCVNDPLREAGITEPEWTLGSFFTSTGKKIIQGEQSHATAFAFLQFLLCVEQGKMVDEWSSLEIKKMLYLTARRIRYVSSPALINAAVYFKSGSQYKCGPEQGYVCTAYAGNIENYMNAAAIIEHPDGAVYMIALMSNVLKKNSMDDHRDIATAVDRIMRTRP